MIHTRAAACPQDASGVDLIDRDAALMGKFQRIWDTSGWLHGEAVAVPTALTQESMKQDFDQIKLFMCVCTAWDLMLGPAPETRRQRKADVEQLKNVIEANCLVTFPASLMSLLVGWQDGKDVAAAVA